MSHRRRRPDHELFAEMAALTMSGETVHMVAPSLKQAQRLFRESQEFVNTRTGETFKVEATPGEPTTWMSGITTATTSAPATLTEDEFFDQVTKMASYVPPVQPQRFPR